MYLEPHVVLSLGTDIVMAVGDITSPHHTAHSSLEGITASANTALVEQSQSGF